MLIKLTKILKVNTGSFFSSLPFFYYKRENAIVKIYDDLDERVVFESESVYGIANVSDRIVYVVSESSVLIVEENGCVSEVIELSSRKQFKAVSAEGHLLLRVYSEDNGWKLYLFRNDGIKKWELNSSEHCLAFFHQKAIVIHWLNLNEVSVIDLEFGTELWRLDLSSKGIVTDSVTGEVYKRDIQFLEVHNDLLVVNIGNGYLAAYNVIDGGSVWEQKLESGEPYLNISQGSIYFLYPNGLGNRFSVYDLYTGQLKYEQRLENEVIRNESFFTRPFLTDDYFMITGHYRKHIFFFNRHTAKLDFTVDLNPYTTNSFGYDNAPQLHGKYLYQLDNEGQLFVFEMEELG